MCKKAFNSRWGVMTKVTYKRHIDGLNMLQMTTNLDGPHCEGKVGPSCLGSCNPLASNERVHTEGDS